MSIPTGGISVVILEQLALGEKRVLSLTVAVRKAMAGSQPLKGDLSAAVRAALRSLIASRAVVDFEGVYSLAPRD